MPNLAFSSKPDAMPYLASIVGIKNIVLAVNENDLARYSEKALLGDLR